MRRQVQVLERQIKRVRWTPGDRMLMAALRDQLPAIDMGRTAGATRDRARLASSLGASQMGRLPGPPKAGKTTHFSRMPGADCSHGEGQPRLGLLSD